MDEQVNASQKWKIGDHKVATGHESSGTTLLAFSFPPSRCEIAVSCCLRTLSAALTVGDAPKDRAPRCPCEAKREAFQEDSEARGRV